MVTHDDICIRLARTLRACPGVTLVRKGSSDGEIIAEMDDDSLVYIMVDYDRIGEDWLELDD